MTRKSLSWTILTSTRLMLFKKSFMRLLRQQAHLLVKKWYETFHGGCYPCHICGKTYKRAQQLSMNKMLSDRGYIACKPPAYDPDDADDLEELTSVYEGGMEDEINREPEGERHVEDHDDEAEYIEANKETDRIDMVCLNPCLPCDETIDNSRNPSVHEAKCHETGNSCVLSERTARTQSNLNGHNASEHTKDCRKRYKILK